MPPAQTTQPDKTRLLTRHPSAFLLVAQVLQLILLALVENMQSQRALISAVSILVLLGVVWVVNHSPAVNWPAWLLAAPCFILTVLSAFSSNLDLVIGSSLLAAMLYFYAAGSLIAYMLSDESVTTDELYALAGTFTLLAWGFAYLYLFCQTLLPGSFVSSLVVDRPLNFLEYLSLSFTNLTATGLGDILPHTPWARILVMLTQFVGIGYLATVVSRLIGMTLQKQPKHP